MIPVLYPATETAYTTNGLGGLPDAINCVVTEQRNAQGGYYLEMDYPIDGLHYADIAPERIIYAAPFMGATPQPFRISRINRPINGIVHIEAPHISAELQKLTSWGIDTGTNVQGMIYNQFYRARQLGQTVPFWCETDITVQSDVTFSHPEPTTLADILLGSEGSVLDVVGGEYEFDGYHIILHSQRGTDSGLEIRYGVNMSDIEAETDAAELVTAVIPFWKGTVNEQDVVVMGDMCSADNASAYAYVRCVPLDVTEQFELEQDQQPTSAQVTAKGTAFINSTGRKQLQMSIRVKYEPTTNGIGERLINLCDTVRVVYPDLGVSSISKVVETRFNVLTEQYDELTIGSIRNNIVDTIAGLISGGAITGGGGSSGGGGGSLVGAVLYNMPQNLNEAQKAQARSNIGVGSGGSVEVNFPYITPEDYGAVGDGSTDDTDAVQHALAESITSGKTLFLERKYLVTETLLPNSYYSQTSATVNIVGASPMNREQYTASSLGGGTILFEHGENGLHLFDGSDGGLTLRGTIHGVKFAPTARAQKSAIFYRCILRGFVFESCFVLNVLAFMHNSNARFTTKIRNSTFLTCYYFSKEDGETAHSFTDSTIEGCYINGGSEMTDNHCFEWSGFNGSTVTENFIDYYRTIYAPQAPTKVSFQAPISANNQYQVFRYFYDTARCTSIQLQSDSDCFNWTAPSTLEKLQGYTPLTYTGHDEQTHEMPPYVLGVFETGKVEINNAIFQSNIGNIVFVRNSLTNYDYAKAKLTCNLNNSFFTHETYVKLADSVYANGSYKLNLVDVPFIKDVESLPSIGYSWSGATYPGMRVRYGGHIYRYRWVRENDSWVAKWVDEIPHVTQETVDESIASALDTSLYEPLDYLESDGASYIDTGILPSADLRVIARFQHASAASIDDAERQYIWGAFTTADGSAESRYQFYYGGTGKSFAGYGDTYRTFNLTVDADEHTASINNGTFSFDSVGQFKLESEAFESPNPIYLFACNENGTADHYSNGMQIKAVSFYRGDTQIARFVPRLRKTDGAIGMFDQIGGAFYPNQGTGKFKNDAIEPDYYNVTLNADGTVNTVDSALDYNSAAASVLNGKPKKLIVTWGNSLFTADADEKLTGGDVKFIADVEHDGIQRHMIFTLTSANALQTTLIETYARVPSVVWEVADVTQGLLARNTNISSNLEWHLTGLNLAPFKRIKIYAKAGRKTGATAQDSSIVPAVIIEMLLDDRAKETVSQNVFIGSAVVQNPNDANRLGTLTCAVSGDKTKFAVTRATSLYGTAATSNTDCYQYVFKIEGYYD